MSMFIEGAEIPPVVLSFETMERFRNPGVTVLKFGRSGQPHERVFKITGDYKDLSWQGGWLVKLGYQQHVDLRRITRIVHGQTTAPFLRHAKKFGFNKDAAMSLIYTDRKGVERTLDFIVPSQQDFNFVFMAFKAIKEEHAKKKEKTSVDDQYLFALWDKADRDKSGVLSFKEILGIIISMNIDMPKKKIEEMFKKVDVDGSKSLNQNEFFSFVDLLRQRIDLEHIWHCLVNDISITANTVDASWQMVSEAASSKKKPILLATFIDFWASVQGGTTMSEDEAIRFIERANPSVKLKPPPPAKSLFSRRAPAAAAAGGGGGSGDEDVDPSLPVGIEVSYGMFYNVMTSKSNDAFDSASKGPVNPTLMDRPLSYYYIASSHNTYLEGDQLTSNSSIKRYQDDLLSGCRCIELDCWDGPDKNPIITHGNTGTTSIDFADTIRGINAVAFTNSKYPVVLSLEMHCSLEQQQTCANILKRTFGDKLALPIRADPGVKLPSPESLKCKFLIKGKRVDGDLDIKHDESVEGAELDESLIKHAESLSRDTHPDLSNITFLSTGKVKKFDETSLKLPCDVMCSYSEDTTMKNLKKPETVTSWIEHNKGHISRVYPKGLRIDSSNYLPTPAWACGNQMVALNYQTKDDPWKINFAKFRENGQCGYVVKPEFMINSGAQRQPAIIIKINVLSAFQLPKPGGNSEGEIIDPFVVVSIVGDPVDNKDFTTRTVQDNGFNPVWNQVCSFRVTNPEVAVLMFKIMDEDVAGSEFVAFSALPITCLLPGIRTLPLFSADGKRDNDFAFATLFAHIVVEWA